MRAVSRLLAVILLSSPVLGRAVTIRVQDPDFEYLTTSPTSFMFAACPGGAGAYMDHGKPISADGCYGGLNGSQDIISSITLTFQNTVPVQNSTVPDGAGSDIFTDVTFSAPTSPKDPNATYSFSFSGGSLAQGQTFVITEDGVPYGDFPTVTLGFTTATPEPSSLVLLATSLVGVCLLYRRHRYV